MLLALLCHLHQISSSINNCSKLSYTALDKVIQPTQNTWIKCLPHTVPMGLTQNKYA